MCIIETKNGRQSGPCGCGVLQSVQRWEQLKQKEGEKHGMCMALQLFHRPGTDAVHVAAGYEDGTVSVWDASQPAQPLMSSRLHSEPVMDLRIDASCRGACFSPVLSSFTLLHTLQRQQELEKDEASFGLGVLWTQSMSHGHVLSSSYGMDNGGARGFVTTMCGDHAGGASASADDKIVTFSIDWEQQQLQQTASLPLKSPGVAALAIRQDSRILAAAGWDSRVRVFHYGKHRGLAVLQYHRDGVLHVCFDARTKCLASASKDGTISLWSIYRDA